MFITILIVLVLPIVAMYWFAKDRSSLDDKFSSIQSSVVGMTYEEIIEHLGPEEGRNEYPDYILITYCSSCLSIFLRPNNDGKWICVDYSYTKR